MGCRDGVQPVLASWTRNHDLLRPVRPDDGGRTTVDVPHVDVSAFAEVGAAYPVQHAGVVERGAGAGEDDGALAVSRAVRAFRFGRRSWADVLGRAVAGWHRVAWWCLWRVRRVVRPVRGDAGCVPAHRRGYPFDAGLDGGQLPDAVPGGRHRMAGSCRRIHRRRRVHVAADFRRARVARQEPDVPDDGVRGGGVGADRRRRAGL